MTKYDMNQVKNVMLHTFINQYNSLVNLINEFPIDNGIKSIVIKHCGDAYVWMKEAFVMMELPDPSDSQRNQVKDDASSNQEIENPQAA